MKAYTDIEQSRKLAEILPVESANMWWNFYSVTTDDTTPRIIHLDTPWVGNFNWNNKPDNIPCWSLTALLKLMPKLYEFENDPDDGGCQPNLCKGWYNNQWHIVYRSSIYITDWYDDPIDAAFEMIVWLKENGKL